MAEKQSGKDRIKEITAGIEQGIKELFESDRYRQYLTTMSRFHHYSLNNVMLIHMQRPNATLVAGFNKWRDQFGRHVKKGEKGIKIIAPAPYKKKIEEMKLDPDTKAPVLDRDGNAVMEEKEVKIPVFKVVSVFDVSQTEGKPLPQLASDLSGNVKQYEVFMEALRRASPVPMEMQTMAADMDGYFDPENQRIAIRTGMSEVQTVSAAIHEIAHSKLHNYEKMQQEAAKGDETKELVKPKDRNTEEVEAESVSYAVCQYYGIQTGENSFGYIATWSQGKELKELRASLETINKTASALITDIDRHFAEICKERGISREDLAATSEQPGAEAPKVEEALYLLDNSQYLHIQLSSAGTWDCTFYDRDTHKQQDGGFLDEPELTIEEARDVILTELGFDLERVETIPQDSLADMLETLQTAQLEPPLGGGDIVDAAVTPYAPNDSFPEIPEQMLDTYPMPDETLKMADLEACGYLDGDMLPISREQAQAYLDNGFSVYSIFDGGGASMCFDQEDIDAAPAELPFAISREEWEESSAFHDKILERQQHQEEREAAFLAHEGDCFAIYQVSRDDPNNVRFMNMDWMQSHGLAIERGNYDLIYTAPLGGSGSTMEQLEKLYEQFNLQKPADFHSPSMSVSDIVAIKQGGKVSYHYCDSVGFQELPGFLPQDNPLKNAEMSMEDDYGMIDGIINNGPKQPTVAELEQQARSGQPISLMDLADAVHREEREKKKSVVEQLHSQPKQ
ncbi:MAG: YodL domain-containing protein, partial [Faecousia sp.]